MRNGKPDHDDFWEQAAIDINLAYMIQAHGKEETIKRLQERYQEAKMTGDLETLNFYEGIINYLSKNEKK